MRLTTDPQHSALRDVAVGMPVGEIGLVAADGSVPVRIALPAPIERQAEIWSGAWELAPQPTRIP